MRLFHVPPAPSTQAHTAGPSRSLLARGSRASSSSPRRPLAHRHLRVLGPDGRTEVLAASGPYATVLLMSQRMRGQPSLCTAAMVGRGVAVTVAHWWVKEP